MVIRLDIEIWAIAKGGTRKGVGKEMGVGGKRYGAAGFCSSCVCYSEGVFLLLY
jgi:hypothetical protein